MATTLVLFIPNSNDEKLFIDIMSNHTKAKIHILNNKHPFYEIFWSGKFTLIRKNSYDTSRYRYKKLDTDSIAALALLPLEAIKPYLLSL